MAEELPFKREMTFAYGEPRELVAGVTRIVANNPGPFTYKGTNTYIVGRADGGDAIAVIDPGPDDDAHHAALMRHIGKRRVSHIVITHTHRDHTDGLARLLADTGARTAGFGRTNAERAARRAAAGVADTAKSLESGNLDFVPDERLGDGATLAGDGWQLTAVHTPGHAADHLCFALGGAKVLFGDHVMSWNTSVVAPPEGNMGDYMRSLEKLMARDDELFLPGHGGQFPQPQRLVRAFAVHRRMREQAIFDCVRKGHRLIADIVPIIYQGLDQRLVGAASMSVLAHVEHLVERGQVTCPGALALDRPIFPV